MIRNATLADIESIASIYNEAINEGGYTGDLVPLSVENRMAWYRDHEAKYAVFVKELHGATVGYTALSPYRKGRQAFSATCEISYYAFRRYRGQGIGKQLIQHALTYAEGIGFSAVIAAILDCNRKSINILKTFAFVECGRLPKAANINGVLIDHIYLSRCFAPRQQ